MPPILYIRYDPAEGEPKSFRFTSGMMTFGRDPGNDITVPSTSVSRQHAKILPVGNHWIFHDLGSTNGSWINDEQIGPSQPRILHTGDELILADSRFSIRLRAEPGHPLGRHTKSILIFEKENFQSEFSLERPENVFTLGSKGAHLRVADAPGDIALEIAREGEKLIAKPVEGYAGVERNGAQILQATPLDDADLLVIQEIKILVNDNPRTILGDSDSTTLENVVEAAEQRTPVLSDVMHSSETIGVAQRTPSRGREWLDDSDSRRGTEGKGRKFVFGEKDGRVDPNSTVSTRPDAVGKAGGGRANRSSTDFDMNISRRVSSIPMPGEKTAAQEKQRRVVIGVLFIAGSFILALFVVLAILLN